MRQAVKNYTSAYKKTRSRLICNFCKTEDIPLYVTLAKPVGTMREQETWVCTKKDVDQLKHLEKK
jgi:hypothetical protein